MERALRSQGYDVSVEGMTKMLTNDNNLRHYVVSTIEDTSNKEKQSQQATSTATNEINDLRSTVRKRESSSYDRRGGSNMNTGDRRKDTRRR